MGKVYNSRRECEQNALSLNDKKIELTGALTVEDGTAPAPEIMRQLTAMFSYQPSSSLVSLLFLFLNHLDQLSRFRWPLSHRITYHILSRRRRDYFDVARRTSTQLGESHSSRLSLFLLKLQLPNYCCHFFPVHWSTHLFDTLCTSFYDFNAHVMARLMFMNVYSRRD